MSFRCVQVTFDLEGPSRTFTVLVRRTPPVTFPARYRVPDDATDEQTALIVGGAVMRAALASDEEDA